MGWINWPTGFTKEVEREQNRRLRAVALQALTSIIERSPVGDPSQWKRPSSAPPGYIGGTFRGNNSVSVAAPDMSYNESITDKTGQRALARGSVVIGSVREPFAAIYVQNNLPYAEAIENGHSGQAPQGVYAVTFDSIKAALK
ncbi:MAG: HK97 gp10 family phage protein [Phycisphaerae bacterium]